jgi:hypothetical protein
MEELEDNISTNDFKRFFRAIYKLSLHMVLNDPPILLGMEPWSSRRNKTDLLEKYDFWMYNKSDYYCIDGFPQDGFPCVVVLPPPYRQGYVYQGIKPAILPVDVASDELLEHVRVKQQDLLDKLKSKRGVMQNNLMVEESNEEEKPEENKVEKAQSIENDDNIVVEEYEEAPLA